MKRIPTAGQNVKKSKFYDNNDNKGVDYGQGKEYTDISTDKDFGAGKNDDERAG